MAIDSKKIDYDLEWPGFETDITDDELSSIDKEADTVASEDTGNTDDMENIVMAACGSIAIQRNIPNLPQIFSTHEKRLAFLSEQFAMDPPATPLQQELLIALYDISDNTGDAQQSMLKAGEYISQKMNKLKPSETLLKKARELSRTCKIDIPKEAIFNAVKLERWMTENSKPHHQ